MSFKASLVILYVKDPMRSAPFYRDLLGLPVKELSPGWAAFDAGPITLALHPHPDMPATREDVRSWFVFEVADPFAEHARLSAKGVTFVRAPVEVCGDEKMVGMSADLEDPDGNRLSLFGMMPRSSLPRSAT
jgi:catechol 2,3-dioxygenase-like lactoylglutathione lyase family enzyme